jgi:hypothetical protein
VSIDNYIWAPAGVRDDKNIGYKKYKSWAEMISAEPSRVPRHQVFLAHVHLIDEQYFFEDAEDARWFWAKGYQERVFLAGDGKTQMSYDRMALWIDGEELATRGYEPEELNAHGEAISQLAEEESLLRDIDDL